jgi:predicted Zn-ribbon and HTH transcriptional regulator
MEASKREGGYLWIRVFFSCCNASVWRPYACLFRDDGKKKLSKCPKCTGEKQSWIQRDETVSKDQPKHDV